MATIYYGKDKKGNPVYESSTTRDAVDTKNAVAAPYSGGSSSSSAPNIVLSSTKYSTDGQAAPTKTQYYSGGSQVSKDVYESASKITSSSLTPNSNINIPTPTPTSTTGTNAMTGVIGALGGAAMNVGLDTTKTTAVPTDLQTRLNAMLDIKRPKTADIYKESQQEVGLQQKQQLVNTYTGQLNAIVAKSQADKLALTGTGRGIPEVIIGGQQAQIDKEAAIQSLPIAAQLSAAQGDLAMAKDHLNTLFTLRSQDAKNEYDFQAKLVDTVFNYADKQQQIQLEAMKTQNAQAFDLKKIAINQANDYATIAINNGQASVAAALGRLDQNDPNYASSVASLASGIRKAPSSSSSGGNPMSTNQIEQFRRSYGWTPPFGFTESQLTQYVKDNPGKTPAQLEAGARQASGGTSAPSTTPAQVVSSILSTMTPAQTEALKKKSDTAGTSQWYRPKTEDVKVYLNSITDKIQTAIDSGYSQDAILEFLTK